MYCETFPFSVASDNKIGAVEGNHQNSARTGIPLIAMNSEPLIGPALPLILSKNDWLMTVDHWSRDHPYHDYITLNPANNVNFAMGHWVLDWGVSDCHGHWSLMSHMCQMTFSIHM
jgi:hypothetical protein